MKIRTGNNRRRAKRLKVQMRCPFCLKGKCTPRNELIQGRFMEYPITYRSEVYRCSRCDCGFTTATHSRQFEDAVVAQTPWQISEDKLRWIAP